MEGGRDGERRGREGEEVHNGENKQVDREWEGGDGEGQKRGSMGNK